MTAPKLQEEIMSEPSEAMIEAGRAECGALGKEMHKGLFAAIYRAMQAARPVGDEQLLREALWKALCDHGVVTEDGMWLACSKEEFFRIAALARRPEPPQPEECALRRSD
jgi:hypothetical protein